MRKRSIAILGSTGSIGRQTLEVINIHPGSFEVDSLVAHSNADLLIVQAIAHQVRAVVLLNKDAYYVAKKNLAAKGVVVYYGYEGVRAIVEHDKVDMIVMALVGYAGLQPVRWALAANKFIALANKETLVVAGEQIMADARQKNIDIYPIDSEHSAIFQCLVGEKNNPFEKIILTASGGPFRGMKKSQLQKITTNQALRNPNWSMGDKVTIDSATLMNKGLELIEARWLFNAKPEQMEVVIHSQSIIHSMVVFEDGAVKAQLGLPDMRLPIQYAMAYPQRLKNAFPRLDFVRDATTLTFDAPDVKTFRNLALAYEALKQGGSLPCVLNAANEEAVVAFLQKKLDFLGISVLVEYCMDKVKHLDRPSYEDYPPLDAETRKIAQAWIQRRN